MPNIPAERSKKLIKRTNHSTAEWRFMTGWRENELLKRLNELKNLTVNFPHEGPESQEGTNWHRYYSEAVIGHERAGDVQQDGVFLKVWNAISEYRFSDPDIVEGHFNPNDPLEGRSILLEIKVLGLRYLCGVRVRAVKTELFPDKTVYGFRYDTLDGHMETGSEWFLLTKIHQTGEIFFRISASWRPGDFPNWWSRVGFSILGQRYQLAWHRLAYLRLREIAGSAEKLSPLPHGKDLVHTGPEVTNSDLWKLEKPTAVQKVIKVSSDENSWTDNEKTR